MVATSLEIKTSRESEERNWAMSWQPHWRRTSLYTPFAKWNPCRERRGVTVQYRHAQASITTYSAVLCCFVLHGRFCSNENVVPWLKLLLGCADVLYPVSLLFCCLFVFFLVSGYVNTLWFLMTKKKLKMPIFQEVHFLMTDFPLFNVCIVNCTYV